MCWDIYVKEIRVPTFFGAVRASGTTAEIVVANRGNTTSPDTHVAIYTHPVLQSFDANTAPKTKGQLLAVVPIDVVPPPAGNVPSKDAIGREGLASVRLTLPFTNTGWFSFQRIRAHCFNQTQVSTHTQCHEPEERTIRDESRWKDLTVAVVG